jgi:LEA14-like dessication related protein
MRTYLLIIMLITLVMVVLGLGVHDIAVRSYTITRIGYDDSFLISGVLTLENPSRLPVPVRSITYDVLTDGGVIATGSLEGFILTPGESSTNMTITLTSENALAALATSEGTIMIEGAANVPFIGRMPFTDSYEVPPLVIFGLESVRSITGEST